VTVTSTAKMTAITTVMPVSASNGVRGLRPRSASAASSFVFSTGCGWALPSLYPRG
jgi:hypothetical protein